jgi:hypothetical protein
MADLPAALPQDTEDSCGAQRVEEIPRAFPANDVSDNSTPSMQSAKLTESVGTKPEDLLPTNQEQGHTEHFAVWPESLIPPTKIKQQLRDYFRRATNKSSCTTTTSAKLNAHLQKILGSWARQCHKVHHKVLNCVLHETLDDDELLIDETLVGSTVLGDGDEWPLVRGRDKSSRTNFELFVKLQVFRYVLQTCREFRCSPCMWTTATKKMMAIAMTPNPTVSVISESEIGGATSFIATTVAHRGRYSRHCNRGLH